MAEQPRLEQQPGPEGPQQPEPGAEQPAPSLRSYFGSPKADDDVFSRLTGPGSRSSAMMASQVNLAQVAAPSTAGGVQVAPPGPPQLIQVPEIAPNVEETIAHEMQEALEYEERRPRFSIGPESAEEVEREVAEVLHQLPATAGEGAASTPETPEQSVPEPAAAPSAEQTGLHLDLTPSQTAVTHPRPDPDFDDVTQQVEEVSLADEAPAPVEPTRYPSGTASLEMDLPATPDDPSMSPAIVDDLTGSLQLHSAETDRQHDAWIPSERTQAVLDSMAHSLPGTFYPSVDSLTLPGCSLQTDLTDPVLELMVQYMTPTEARQRSVLTADSVTQDDRGIRQLIQAGCYRSAVNLTGRLLTNYGQGYGRAGQLSKHTANSVQLWFTRLALLVRLRQFAVAEREAQAWGDLDTADLFFQYYPDLYGGRRGSMVPFSFRVLLAELPRYMAHYQTSLDRLYQIHSVCQQITSNLVAGRSEDGSPSDLSEAARQQSLTLWNSRRLKVLFSVVNCCVGMKDYDQAIECLSQLSSELPRLSAGLRSAVGRVYLQLGNVAAARAAFASVTEAAPASESGHSLQCQQLINAALLAIGENDFADAQSQFERALELEPQNAAVLTNVAVCLLYRGRLAAAVTLLEDAVFARPELLQETVLLNLCTLYELQTSKCNRKKVALLARVGQNRGDGFNVGCLKLQSAA
ncbi:trafficking protein particle complex subunit 12-like isoform X1 [Amphibalanus amphitrite]|uniref:trafficking protein particle complex subunit 12-like isoform X1 n=1 Tax=Amphibalanus amphitrite TaxID=1232801 RepID=UPI001C911E7C|nr:trafficking protein particle complex subunit 12-like isoform X1 [Amphibalanus amphitrite]XP_043244376.1 trafficking protein particle complex subunit 12-like isoform X1 [Amphibalanus amphitrite]XP_043244377.1 trafficking protein particle complex subunit 12-like isoform X1 [Amphibalanus amphitrite]XP_043244378.1 trafficking protein particle complex subunit 12-like isoform X1 [Amphibalanus amphitrite]XP_043244379.1 trafficking protein particle complex subunit 12-like isoform X1 [Amphibalanus am